MCLLALPGAPAKCGDADVVAYGTSLGLDGTDTEAFVAAYSDGEGGHPVRFGLTCATDGTGTIIIIAYQRMPSFYRFIFYVGTIARV